MFDGPLNSLTQTYETECVERKYGRCGLEAWYIKMGFAGFNSPANNRQGYKTKAAAEAACMRYQNKGGRWPVLKRGSYD